MDNSPGEDAAIKYSEDDNPQTCSRYRINNAIDCVSLRLENVCTPTGARYINFSNHMYTFKRCGDKLRSFVIGRSIYIIIRYYAVVKYGTVACILNEIKAKKF